MSECEDIIIVEVQEDTMLESAECEGLEIRLNPAIEAFAGEVFALHVFDDDRIDVFKLIARGTPGIMQ